MTMTTEEKRELIRKLSADDLFYTFEQSIKKYDSDDSETIINYTIAKTEVERRLRSFDKILNEVK